VRVDAGWARRSASSSESSLILVLIYKCGSRNESLLLTPTFTFFNLSFPFSVDDNECHEPVLFILLLTPSDYSRYLTFFCPPNIIRGK
jgi:hypothetical protein